MTITAHKLRRARKRLGLTQAEVAKRAGVTQGTISKWETGKICVVENEAARLAYDL